MPRHAQPKVPVSYVMFPWWISRCKKFIEDLFPSRDINDQSDCTKKFWPITCEAEFSQIWNLQIWNLHRNTENYTVFHFRLHLTKINDKILWKLKKNYFRSFRLFKGKQQFFEKSTSDTFFSFYISTIVENFRKNKLNFNEHPQ